MAIQAGIGLAAILFVVGLVLLFRQDTPEPIGTYTAGGLQPAGDAGQPLASLSPSGQERLVGKVVDAGGKPVAGVLVSAAAEGGALGPPLGEDETSEEGEFAIAGLPAGRLRVSVEGLAVIPAEVRQVAVPGEPLTVVVARRVLIEGSVSEAGKAVGGATIELSGPELASPRTGKSSDDGHFLFDDVPEGSYVLTARRGTRAGTALVERFGSGPFASVPLVLTPAALVEGTVIDAKTRAPVVGARVLLVPGEGGAPRAGETDAAGKFVLEGVTPGQWAIDAIAPGYLPPRVPGLEIAAEQTLAVEVPLERGATVRGRVVDAAGRPVEGARVWLEGEGEAGHVTISAAARARRLARATSAPMPSRAAKQDFLAIGELGVTLGPVPFAPPRGARVARTRRDEPAPDSATVVEAEAGLVSDADGRFTIDAVPPGRFSARAAHPDFAEAGSDELRIGEDREGVKIVLRRGALVRGRVVDATGVSVPGARVLARRGEETLASATADETGGYALPRLSGRVLLAASDGRGGETQLTLELSEKDEGKTIERDLRLGGSGGTLAGRVRDPLGRDLAGARVRVAGRAIAATTDSSGRFALRDVPTGGLTLEISHPDYPTRTQSGVGASADELAVTMPAGGGVDGILRDAHTRQRIAAFSLRADGPGGPVTQNHRIGEFELAPLLPGHWTLTFRATGWAEKRVEVDVPAGREPRAVTVRDLAVELSRGGTLAGTVFDVHGVPAPGATVECGGVKGTTDKRGRFRLVDVPAGDRSVIARLGASRGEKPVAVRPGDEIATFELRLE